MSRKLLDRQTRLTDMDRLATNKDAIAALHTAPPKLPQLLGDWLGQKLLFQGIPFDYLVADDQLLPKESIRFFTVDANWQAALADGACSIGRIGPLDMNTDSAFLFTPGGFFDQARTAAQIQGQVISGFLLRSQAVSGYWPGIRIEGWADSTASQALKILRIECLASNVLLVLFDGALARVDVHEPPEGMHFGLEGPDALSSALLRRRLRYLTGNATHAPGAQMDGTVAANYLTIQKDTDDYRYLRDSGVLKANTLASALGGVLAQRGAMPVDGGFTSAEFGLEMIEGVDLVSYTVPTNPAETL